MRRRSVLLIPVLTAGILSTPGVASAAWAEPPHEVATGTFQVVAFTLTPEDTTDPVRHFSFRSTVLVSGDLPGTFTEVQECLRKGDVVRCHGTGTTLDEEGEPTGTLRSHIVCTQALVCTGMSVGNVVTEDGRLVWLSDITTDGLGGGTYVARVVRSD